MQDPARGQRRYVTVVVVPIHVNSVIESFHSCVALLCYHGHGFREPFASMAMLGHDFQVFLGFSPWLPKIGFSNLQKCRYVLYSYDSVYPKS